MRILFCLCLQLGHGGLVHFAELGRGHADVLLEHPVKLGKATKTAAGRGFRNGNAGAHQQRLHISNPGHLDVIRQCKAGDILKLMG